MNNKLFTFSRSWYHCRQVLSNASKNVSFLSLAIIEIQSRAIGKAYLYKTRILILIIMAN